MKVMNLGRIKMLLSVTFLIVGLTLVITLIAPETAGQTPPPKLDITGIWTGDDNGTYYVRQVGNTVWWMGQSQDGGVTFTNVFNGTRKGGQITGFWADVPAGKNTGGGWLTLSISLTGGVEIRKVGAGGNGFGASVWRRRGVTPQPTPLPPGVCTISGRVDRDRPEYRTRIRLYRPDGSPTSYVMRVLGGRYRFTNIPEGNYEVRGSGSFPSTNTPRGPVGPRIFAEDDQRITCERNGSVTLNFAIRSSEG